MLKEFKPSIFTNTTGISYTPDQLITIEGILNWFRRSNSICMTLKGPAGTGKTTILKEVVANIKGSIAVTAPTHKAVRVASKHINVTGNTIHKLLGLYPNTSLETFDHNNPKFDPNGRKYIKDYRIVIVDECSMITNSIDSLLMKEATRYGTKILYVGDPYQLPPIQGNSFNTFMPAFKHPSVELITIVRQEKGNPVLELLGMLRSDVKNKSANFINYIYKNNTKINSEGIGYIATSSNHHFSELLLDKFNTDTYFNNIEHVKYLAFTNNNVNDVNMFIRNHIIETDNEMLVRDDLLISYQSIMDEFNSLVITNSENYIIYKDNITKFVKDGIHGYLVKLQNTSTNEITPTLFILNHLHVESVNLYMTIFNKLINAAKTAKNPINRVEAWKKFYSFQREYILMNKLIKPTGQLITDLHISYGHATTIHKSQGSTYSNVGVNVKNIVYSSTGMPYPNIDIRNRLLYVAISRARENVMLYI
jgi:hypothetical protein